MIVFHRFHCDGMSDANEKKGFDARLSVRRGERKLQKMRKGKDTHELRKKSGRYNTKLQLRAF